MEIRKGETYQLTEIGMIPADWSLIAVNELLEFKNGLNKAKEFFGYGTPIVNYMDVFKNPGLLKSDIDGKVNVTKDEQRNYKVNQGDVFFTRTSETIEEIGMSSVMLDDIPNAVFSGFVLRGRPKNDILELRFKKYCFRSEVVRKQIVSTSSYTTRALTNGRLLSKVLIPLPENKIEQTAIATALSDIDALIYALEELIVKKRGIKQGAMQELLKPKDGWLVKKLGEILKVGHGKSQKDVVDEYGEYPILASGGVIGKANRYLYNKPSVLIGRKGTIDEPQYMDKPFWTIDTLFYTDIFEPNHAKYIYYQFNLIDWYFYNEASGVPSLNAKTIENIEISIPEPPEQIRIANILSDMDNEIEAIETKLIKYKKIRQGMMQNLLTGRIRLV